jgi:hypothetical protein
MFYYVYGVCESACYITSMVSGSLYVILLLWYLGVCMVYYVYGVWESVCYITSMVSGSLQIPRHHRRNRPFRLPDTIDII